jgi:hypothetical protein
MFNSYLHDKYVYGMRFFATKHSVLNVDWHRLMADSKLDGLTYLRDDMHPTTSYSASFGRLLLRISWQDLFNQRQR